MAIDDIAIIEACHRLFSTAFARFCHSWERGGLTAERKLVVQRLAEYDAPRMGGSWAPAHGALALECPAVMLPIADADPSDGAGEVGKLELATNGPREAPRIGPVSRQRTVRWALPSAGRGLWGDVY